MANLLTPSFILYYKNKLLVNLQNQKNMYPKKLQLLLILISGITQGQTYVKFNTVTAIGLIPNIGIEMPICKKLTFQADVTASFWKSIHQGPLQFVMVIPEIRYHLNENNKGFYIGAHLGGSIFKLQKWGYAETRRYQEGYNYLLGGTIGYQREISKNLALDIFIGGGNQQAFYKGYYLDSNIRYDTAKNYNRSGESLPYRGGIMLCYKIN